MTKEQKMAVIYIVYKVINLINNKFYIGVHRTNNINDEYMGSGKIIIRAIEKYGIDNFKKEIIGQFNNKIEAYDLERTLITDKLIKSEECYNLRPGGIGGDAFSHLSAKEYQKAIDSMRRNRKDVSGINNANYGHKWTDKLKKRMSKLKSGGVQSQEAIAKRIEKTKGLRRSENTKQKMRNTWRIIDPDNNQYIVHNLMDFCSKNNLRYASMVQVAKHPTWKHKKYQCRRIKLGTCSRLKAKGLI